MTGHVKYIDNEFDETEIPSSNDTRYIISKPIILNLDSSSSRYTIFKTHCLVTIFYLYSTYLYLCQRKLVDSPKIQVKKIKGCHRSWKSDNYIGSNTEKKPIYKNLSREI